MERDISVGGLLRQTFAIIGGDAGMFLLVLGAIVGVSTLLDIVSPNGGNFLSIPILVVQYYMIRRLVDRHGLRVADRPANFGSFFLLGIITGLGILLGFVLLIIPGIYLTARWAMCDVALLAENRGSSAAAGRSWAVSEGHVLPLILSLLVLNLPVLAGFGLIFGTADVLGTPDAIAPGAQQSTVYVVAVLINLFLYVAQLANWYFGVAAYALIVGRPEAQLNEVFA